jgi:dTDP-4-dehydrorhamnose 3,5-epimerase-like enzyme
MNNRVAEPKLGPMTNVLDERGKLVSLEFSAHKMKRFYYIKADPQSGKRGNHAHKLLTQIMFSLHGTWKVRLTRQGESQDYQLHEDSNYLLIPAGYWRVFESLDKNAILGVIASEVYDESDYIRNFDEFEEWEKNN